MNQGDSTPLHNHLALDSGGYNSITGEWESDEQIAQRLHLEQLGQDYTHLGAIDEHDLQIARDAELAHYMGENDGALPQHFEDIPAWQWAGGFSILVGDGPDRTMACIACDDQKDPNETVRGPCGHEYCGDCLGQLFRQSMTEEQYFPPRCCTQEVPLARARAIIDQDLAQHFEDAYLELSTTNRTYCHSPACGAFIPPTAIHADVGTCNQCQQRTCSICKGRNHQGDCPQDPAFQQLLATANQQGWRPCSRCNRMIELTVGCNHMSCLCGNQFCYVCGRGPWKACRCDAFDQRRLLIHAEDIVGQGRDVQNERDEQRDRGIQGQPVVAGQDQQARVGLVARQLVENHNGCTHPMPWSRYQAGEHECWVCHQRKGNKTVGWCRRCYFVACYSCRRRARNRLR